MKAADEKLTMLALSDERSCTFCPTPLKEVKNEMTKCVKMRAEFLVAGIKTHKKKCRRWRKNTAGR